MVLSKLHDLLNNLTNTDTTSYTDAEKSTDLTGAAQVLTGEIISALMDWDYQGDTATANIVASTAITNRYYAFPTNFLKLKSVYLMADGTNWRKCTYIDIGEVGSLGKEADVVAQFSNDTPYYSIVGNKILILSGTLSAVTTGLRYYFTEMVIGVDKDGVDITTFNAVTGTSDDVPNMPSPYQMGLVYYAAKLYYQRFQIWEAVQDMNRELYGNPNGRAADENRIGGIVGAMRKFKVTEEKSIVQPASSLENYE